MKEIENRKRKEEKKRKEKYEMDPGETFQPNREKEPAAHLLIPEPVPYPTLSL
jgi:hypothetical protein